MSKSGSTMMRSSTPSGSVPPLIPPVLVPQRLLRRRDQTSKSGRRTIKSSTLSTTLDDIAHNKVGGPWKPGLNYFGLSGRHTPQNTADELPYESGQVLIRRRFVSYSHDSSGIVRIKTGPHPLNPLSKDEGGTFAKQVRISIHGAGWRESALNQWIENPGGYLGNVD